MWATDRQDQQDLQDKIKKRTFGLDAKSDELRQPCPRRGDDGSFEFKRIPVYINRTIIHYAAE